MFRSVVFFGRFLKIRFKSHATNRVRHLTLASRYVINWQALRTKSEIVSKTEILPNFLQNIIKSYNNDIDWDSVIKEVLKRKTYGFIPIDAGNVSAVIMGACQKENLYGPACSFFRYVTNKERVNYVILHSFLCFQESEPMFLESNKQILYKVFLHAKNEAVINHSVLKLCINLLMKCEEYWKEAWETFRALYPDELINELFTSPISFGEPQKALNFFSSSKLEAGSSIMDQFLKFTINEVDKGQIPVRYFIQFFDALCKKEFVVGKDKTWINSLRDLFLKLNAVDGKYEWKIAFSVVNLKSICSVCWHKLDNVVVTKEEVDLLKDEFEKKVVIQDNIHLRTDPKEWEKFMTYIRDLDYNIVLDGLNLSFILAPRNLKLNPILFNELLNSFDARGLKPFILAKKHFAYKPEYKMVKGRYPVFLTKNLSDDDVFFIYAALSSGHKCLTITRDHLRDYKAHFFHNSSLYSTFVRWQRSRQCGISKGGRFIPPFPLSFVMQRLNHQNKDEGEFHYHLPFERSMVKPINEALCFSRKRRQSLYSRESERQILEGGSKNDSLEKKKPAERQRQVNSDLERLLRSAHNS